MILGVDLMLNDKAELVLLNASGESLRSTCGGYERLQFGGKMTHIIQCEVTENQIHGRRFRLSYMPFRNSLIPDRCVFASRKFLSLA